jgi:GH35 family endo-1,4-beta-xylanase
MPAVTEPKLLSTAPPTNVGLSPPSGGPFGSATPHEVRSRAQRSDIIFCDQETFDREASRLFSVRWAAAFACFGLATATGCSSDGDALGPAQPADAYADFSHAVDSGIDNSPRPDVSTTDVQSEPARDATEEAESGAARDGTADDTGRADAVDVALPPVDAAVDSHDVAARDADGDGADGAPSDGNRPDANDAGGDSQSNDGGRPIDTMAGAALTRGHHMGTAVKAELLDSATEPQYTTVLTTHFDLLVAEYQMKWGTTQATRGQFNFAPGDQIVAFASRHGMMVKGHTLIWHQSLPAWVTALAPAEVGPVLDAQIAAVVGHWKGKLYAWDVVNEAITDDGAGYRSSIWFQHLGAAFIERAFRAARAADPAAQLLYNDYGGEALNTKSNRIYTLVRDLKNAGVPIDGVGLQFHVNGAAPPPLADVATNLDRLIALGLTVNFSEIDVRVADVPGTQAEKLARQRTLYHDIIALCAARPQCHSASTWGITDKYTWIDMQYGAGHMPLPFDVNYAAKPAVAGVIDAWLGK